MTHQYGIFAVVTRTLFREVMSQRTLVPGKKKTLRAKLGTARPNFVLFSQASFIISDLHKNMNSFSRAPSLSSFQLYLSSTFLDAKARVKRELVSPRVQTPSLAQLTTKGSLHDTGANSSQYEMKPLP